MLLDLGEFCPVTFTEPLGDVDCWPVLLGGTLIFARKPTCALPIPLPIICVCRSIDGGSAVLLLLNSALSSSGGLVILVVPRKTLVVSAVLLLDGGAPGASDVAPLLLSTAALVLV